MITVVIARIVVFLGKSERVTNIGRKNNVRYIRRENMAYVRNVYIYTYFQRLF